MKDINEFTKKDFETIKRRAWNQKLSGIDSIVIVPSKSVHDSGFRCIDYVAIKGEDMWMCGGGDVINLDGIGGYGKWEVDIPRLISIKGWSIDCLKRSGYMRLWSNNKLECDPDLSSMCVYSMNKRDNK